MIYKYDLSSGYPIVHGVFSMRFILLNFHGG